MRTDIECRSLGESRSNYTTDASSSSVRQMKQQDTYSKKKIKKSKDSDSSGGAGLAVGLIAGAAVGAIAGILMAPEKGTATRRKVSESANKLGSQVSDQVTKGFSSTKDKVSDWTNKTFKKGEGTSTGTSSSASAGTMGGKVQKSPYTDVNKHSDQEVKNMINDPRNPGGPGATGV
jgi:gas vesicle protein